jgi:hypothetical protein
MDLRFMNQCLLGEGKPIKSFLFETDLYLPIPPKKYK